MVRIMTRTVIAGILVCLTWPVVFAANLQNAEQSIRLKQFTEAAEELEVLAETGNQEARYRLAGLYHRGLGVPRDVARATSIYSSLADEGHEGAKLAIERGAIQIDPSADDASLRLIKAAERGQHDVLEVLLEGGARPDTAGPFGRTALIEAAESGQVEAVRLLLKSGASADQADVSGDTAPVSYTHLRAHETF